MTTANARSPYAGSHPPPYPPEPPETGTAARRVSALARALRRHVGLVALIALPLPVAAAVVSLLLSREYMVAASFMPQEPGAAAGGLGALGSQLGIAVGRASTGPQFYADLLSTKTMLKDVVLTRYDVPGFRGTLIDYYGARGDSARSLLKAQRELDESLGVTTNRSTGVVRMTVRTRNPALSLAVAERFLGLLNDFNLNRRQSSGRVEREFLERRVELARQELDRADRALTNFLASNRGDFGSAPALQRERTRLEREVSLRQSAVVGLAQQLEGARTEEIRNTPVITIVELPEDTIEPVGRGVVTRTLLAGVAGLLIAVAVVWWRSTRDAEVTPGGALDRG